MTLTPAEVLQFIDTTLELDTAAIKPDSLLFSTGIIDSFALVSLMTFIEQQCGVRIEPQDVNLNNFDSIERMLAYVTRLQATSDGR